MAFEEVKLSELASYISRGITPAYVKVDGISVINQKCIRNGVVSLTEARLHDVAKKKVPADKLLQQGDILVNSTGTGTLGRVAQVTEPLLATVDSHVTIVRPRDGVDPLFLGYAVKWRQPYIEALAEGSTGQTELSRYRLGEEITIPLPSLPVQQQIGRLLYAIDCKIKINNKINDNLQQQAQAVYTAMFISNADPAWVQGRLSDLITVKYGKDHKKLADGVYPVFGSGGIMRYVERPLYTEESVLIPRKGTLNNVIYVNEPFWSVDTMFFTEMKMPNVAKFVFHFVKAKDLASMNAGSAVPSMTTDILNAMELAIPSAERLAEFESVVAPMYQAIQANNRESAKLVEVRDSLLPQLMSGEVDVSSVQV